MQAALKNNALIIPDYLRMEIKKKSVWGDIGISRLTYSVFVERKPVILAEKEKKMRI